MWASGFQPPSPNRKRAAPATSSQSAGAVSHSEVGNLGILRIDRSRVSTSVVTKMRHTTNSAFTISQTSNHPIIPT